MKRILIIMGRQKRMVTPSLGRILRSLGEQIRLARLRRQFSTTLLSERAGISRTTLGAIEKGEPSVSIGAYANILFCLGLEKDLLLLAQDDELGRKLQDAKLPQRARAPKRSKKKNE